MKIKYALACSVLFLVACGGIPKDALQFNQDTLAVRQLQTRKFEIKDEKTLILSAAGVLQDMGYAIDESETKLGVVVGSKKKGRHEWCTSCWCRCSCLVGWWLYTHR